MTARWIVFGFLFLITGLLAARLLQNRVYYAHPLSLTISLGEEIK